MKNIFVLDNEMLTENLQFGGIILDSADLFHPSGFGKFLKIFLNVKYGLNVLTINGKVKINLQQNWC
jgi:hypothetical protein